MLLFERAVKSSEEFKIESIRKNYCMLSIDIDRFIGIKNTFTLIRKIKTYSKNSSNLYQIAKKLHKDFKGDILSRASSNGITNGFKSLDFFFHWKKYVEGEMVFQVEFLPNRFRY